MKKIISVLIIISVSVALFALDISAGIDPMHNYDATATVSAYLNNLEFGGGVYTNAVGKLVYNLADSTYKAEFKEKFVNSFKTAEYGAMGHVYYNFVNNEVQVAAGGIVELGSIQELKERVDSKKISMNFLASAKATYHITNFVGIFAQAGVPVATFNISGSSKQFESLVKDSGEAIWDYVKANGRVQFGVTFTI